jgi:DME family drug/metabolite transporter
MAILRTNFSIILMCLAAISWGTTGTTMVLMSQTVPWHPLLVGFWRLAIASVVLMVAARERFTWQWAELKVYAGLGLCMALYQATYFWAVPLTGVAMTALVAICSSPFFIAGLAVIFLGERLSRRTWIALGLGSLGAALLVAQPQASSIWGIALALGAGLAYASYVVIAKAYLAKLDTLVVTAGSFTAAALWLAPCLAWLPSPANAWASWPFLVYLGIVPTGLAYIFYMLGLNHTPATTAGIIVLLEPLTAACLGIFWFKEPVALLGLAGALMLLSAIFLAQNEN